MKKFKMRTCKRKSLLLLAGALLSCIVSAQNVFTVDDSGDHVSGGGTPGQLRWAVRQAMAASGESIINFNIPGPGPYIIPLYATLPVITKPVTIDGTTQPGYDPSNGSPVIIINGYNNGMGLVTNCLTFDSTERCKISGLYIRQFMNGIVLNSCNYFEIVNNIINRTTSTCMYLGESHFNVIKGNTLNIEKDGTVTYPHSGEGIYMQGSNDNTVGGRLCGEGNTVAYVRSEGIDNYNDGSTPGQRNLYSGNRLYENDSAWNYDDEILIRPGGNGGKQPPTIVTTGCIVSGTSQGNNIIELFGSSGPVSQNLNAKVFMGWTKANAAGQWSMPVSNILYPFVLGMATDSINNTSETGTVAAIAVDTVKLTIKNPTVCLKEKVRFEVTGTKCTKTLTYMWDYGDGSPLSASPEHIYYAPGNYTVNLTAYDNNSCATTYTATTTFATTTCPAYDCISSSDCGLVVIMSPLSESIFSRSSDPGVVMAGLIGAVAKVVMNGTPPYTFFWSVARSTGNTVNWAYVTPPKYPPLPENTSAINFTKQNDVTTTATVVVTDANGCTTYKQFTQ